MNKINWEVRIKNKQFWIALIPALLLLIQVIAAVFGFTLDLGDLGNKLLAVVNALFAVLSILGIVVDPNTEGIAEEVGRQTGADLFEITLVDPYSSDYNTVLEEAQRDQNEQARPALAGRWKTWSSTPPFCWATPTGGRRSPCPLLPFWRNTTSAARRSSRFAATAEGALAKA